MSEIKVNVVIAGRTYPLKVNSTQEEEGMRRAAKNINDLIVKFETNYAVADKQDVLAMSALQFASKLEISSINIKEEDISVLKKIESLSELIESNLK